MGDAPRGKAGSHNVNEAAAAYESKQQQQQYSWQK